MLETELCAKLVHHFHALNLPTYQEVQSPRGRTDIVVDIKGVHHAIEVKRASGWDVFEQAYRWREVAHFAYTATPNAPHKSNIDYCRSVGIGIIQIRKDSKPVLLLKPVYNPDPIKFILFSEQTTLSAAGSKYSGYWRPSKEQWRSIRHHFKSKNPKSLGLLGGHLQRWVQDLTNRARKNEW